MNVRTFQNESVKHKEAGFPFFARYAETIVDNGYSVVAVQPRTKRPRFKQWQTACFKDTDHTFLSRHVNNRPNDSIGIACGTKVIAIDIDETDPDQADTIHRLAVETFGDTALVRYGKFPKRTLVYRSREPIDTVRVCKLDILGRGAQFVAFGIHPITQRPYYWLEGSPTDTDLQSLTAIDKTAVELFIQRAQELSGTQRQTQRLVVKAQQPKPSVPRSVKSGLTKSDQQGLEVRIVRDQDNRVIDGREAHMTLLTWEEYHKGCRDAKVLANRVWTRFSATADLARVKSNSRRDHYRHKDALAKAKQIVKKAPVTRPKQKLKLAQGSHLHSMGKAGYWTFERKQGHQTEAAMRGLASSRLTVNQAMLDATSSETGQCDATVKVLIGTTSLSISAVKSSRRDLVQQGLWIVERSVYVPSLPYTLDVQEDENEFPLAA